MTANSTSLFFLTLAFLVPSAIADKPDASQTLETALFENVRPLTLGGPRLWKELEETPQSIGGPKIWKEPPYEIYASGERGLLFDVSAVLKIAGLKLPPGSVAILDCDYQQVFLKAPAGDIAKAKEILSPVPQYDRIFLSITWYAIDLAPDAKALPILTKKTFAAIPEQERSQLGRLKMTCLTNREKPNKATPSGEDGEFQVLSAGCTAWIFGTNDGDADVRYEVVIPSLGNETITAELQVTLRQSTTAFSDCGLHTNEAGDRKRIVAAIELVCSAPKKAVTR